MPLPPLSPPYTTPQFECSLSWHALSDSSSLFSSVQAARCGLSQFLQSVSHVAPAHDAPQPILHLPAAAAAAFVSEISASDFVSGGSSSGGGSIFAAIADVDVKVAAVNRHAPYYIPVYQYIRSICMSRSLTSQLIIAVELQRNLCFVIFERICVCLHPSEPSP
jgi:hypothetical protein